MKKRVIVLLMIMHSIYPRDLGKKNLSTKKPTTSEQELGCYNWKEKIENLENKIKKSADSTSADSTIEKNIKNRLNFIMKELNPKDALTAALIGQIFQASNNFVSQNHSSVIIRKKFSS